MMKFASKPYEQFKDTETKWLGLIPAHWGVKRVKEEFISLDYKRIPLSGEERQTMTDSIYDYYGASGIIDKVDNYIFALPQKSLLQVSLLLRNTLPPTARYGLKGLHMPI